MTATFHCAHPREPWEADAPWCRVCLRVRKIIARLVREQRRINEGRSTLGQKIVRGIA